MRIIKIFLQIRKVIAVSEKIYYYQNLSLPENLDSLDVLVWGIYAGIVIGATVATLDKLYCGRMVKALIEKRAQTSETAVTLNALDIKGKWYLRRALREGKPLRKMLGNGVIEDKKKTAEIPFFLPEENRIKAETRYENGRRPIFTLILAIFAMLAVVFFVLFAVPELLTMLDNLVGMVKNG